MKLALVLGVVLIVLGAFLLYFGGIPYVKEHTLRLGPLPEVKAEEHELYRVQPVISVLVLAGGIALVVIGARKN
jgi:hypothetical protein